MTGWIIAGIVFALLLAMTHHTTSIEAERDEALDSESEALAAVKLHRETIANQRRQHAELEFAFRHNQRLLKIAICACNHALHGRHDDAFALLNEHSNPRGDDE